MNINNQWSFTEIVVVGCVNVHFVIIIIEDIRVSHCGFCGRCEDRVQVSGILSAGCIDRQSCDEEDVEKFFHDGNIWNNRTNQPLFVGLKLTL